LRNDGAPLPPYALAPTLDVEAGSVMVTPGICEGDVDGAVSADKGCVAVGVEESRSVYDTNERRLFACDVVPPGTLDTGVVGLTSNWRAVGGAEDGDAGAEGATCCCCVFAPGGMFSRSEFRFPLRGLGLGLRLRKLPMGDAKPLLRLRTVPVLIPWSSSRPPEDAGAGAMTAMESPSSDVMDVRIDAALSSTEGTLWSSISVFLERAVRCGSFLAFAWGGETGEMWMGSMSRSNIAEDEEWTEVGLDGIDEGDLEPFRTVRC
jgi:hypothetical protein